MTKYGIVLVDNENLLDVISKLRNLKRLGEFPNCLKQFSEVDLGQVSKVTLNRRINHVIEDMKDLLYYNPKPHNPLLLIFQIKNEHKSWFDSFKFISNVDEILKFFDDYLIDDEALLLFDGREFTVSEKTEMIYIISESINHQLDQQNSEIKNRLTNVDLDNSLVSLYDDLEKIRTYEEINLIYRSSIATYVELLEKAIAFGLDLSNDNVKNLIKVIKSEFLKTIRNQVTVTSNYQREILAKHKSKYL